MPTVETKPLPTEILVLVAAAGKRNRVAADELERLGIANNEGNRIRTDLPKDMREDAGCDFGG